MFQHGAPALQGERSEEEAEVEVVGRVSGPLLLEERDGKDQGEEVDRVNARDAGNVEGPLAERWAVSVVVRQNEARNEKEKAYEDKGVVDDGAEDTNMRGREVEQHDVDGENGSKAGERGKGWLADGRGVGRLRLSWRFGRQNGDFRRIENG